MLTENNGVEGSESCLFVEYLLRPVLLFQSRSSAGQVAYRVKRS